MVNSKWCLIFDMDGVLVDSEAVIEEAARLGLQEYGVFAKSEDFKPFVGAGEDRFIGGVAEKYGVTYHTDMKKRVYEIYLEQVEHKLKVYPNTVPLLKKLVEIGCHFALGSSADRIKVNANLNVANIDMNWFKGIVTGDDVVHKKPAPDIYLKAAALLGAEPKHCIVVEDALNGIQAAHAAGMKCIGITTSFTKEELKANHADFICDDLLDIIGILELM